VPCQTDDRAARRREFRHVQQAVIHAADVQQSVILGRPPWKARERGLDSLAGQRFGRSADRITRERPRSFGGVRAGVTLDDDVLAHGRRSLERQLNWERPAHDERLRDAKRAANVNAHQI
jgi:hypothetical protein